MDLTLTADQRAMRSALRELVADLWPQDRLRDAADAPTLDTVRWVALAQLGLFGLILPQDEGGMGLGLVDAAVLFEELGRGLVPGPVVPTALASALVPEVLTGKAVVAMLDVRDPTHVAEHLESATHLVAVDDDGLFLLPAGEYTHRPVDRPLDPLTPLSLVTLPRGLGEREIGRAHV